MSVITQGIAKKALKLNCHLLAVLDFLFACRRWPALRFVPYLERRAGKPERIAAALD